MSDTHTLEPWEVVGDQHHEYSGAVVLGPDNGLIADANIFATEVDRSEEVCMANAKRIVACVNAYRGQRPLAIEDLFWVARRVVLRWENVQSRFLTEDIYKRAKTALYVPDQSNTP